MFEVAVVSEFAGAMACPVAARPVSARVRRLVGTSSRTATAVSTALSGPTAASAATARPGPLQDLYHTMTEHGMRAEMARLTLARKIAALSLRIWKTGERYDPIKLTMQAR